MDDDSQIDLQVFSNIVNHLGEQDLLALNQLIAERIKVVRAEKKVQSMAAFEVGDAVFFTDKQQQRVDATVLRLNKKTLSLVTDDGERWNVAPELCQINEPTTGDLFEQEISSTAGNVSVLPTAATNQIAGRWYGGVIEMPAYVSDGGQSYRPHVLMWLDSDGLVAATEVCEPESDPKEVALSTLRQALHSPMTGKPPQQPKYITVNDAEIANYLAERVTGINIEHGATPMLDEVVDGIANGMPPGEPVDTYLSTGLSAERISDFFDAAALLYHSAPWEQVPHDACLLSVTIESLGIHDAVLSVIGQKGESFGIIVYASMQQYCHYHIASDRMRRGLECDIPPHSALSFDEGADVSASIRKEIAEHGWQVPNTSSYPILFTPDRDNFLRPLAATDVALFEALSRALPVVLKDRRTLINCWNGEDDYRKRITVDSVGERVAVEIAAPYPFENCYGAKDPFDSTMVELALLSHTADEPSYEANAEICEDLQALFFKSPEGKKCKGGASMVTPLLHFSFTYQSATIATLQAGSLEEIVFEIVPRKVMTPPDTARAIIEEYRLFYRFLKRVYSLPQADQCLEVLGGNAIARLKAALSDTGGFGPGKAALASGMLAGSSGQLPPGLSLGQAGMPATGFPPAPAGKPVDSNAKKKKRKEAKKARKKNR